MFVSARTNKEHHHLLPRVTLSPPSLIIQCKFPADCHRDGTRLGDLKNKQSTHTNGIPFVTEERCVVMIAKV